MDCKEVKISELGNGRDFGENLCVATLDLGQVKKITHIEINALQDIKPWIWSPKRVSFYASSDGEHFELLEHVESRLTEEDEEVQIETFPCETTVDAQFLKIETVSRGEIPEWHLGRGNPRWTFLDEIMVEIAD